MPGKDVQEENDKPLTLWQVISSSLASAFGVQAHENRERDFAQGKAGQFILAGVVLTAGFVAGMAALVNLVVTLSK